MLEETHRRISRWIAKELKLTRHEALLLEAGSVNPDRWVFFPHHRGKEYDIARNILESRKLYLRMMMNASLSWELLHISFKINGQPAQECIINILNGKK
jgi:hypothetical protein